MLREVHFQQLMIDECQIILNKDCNFKIEFNAKIIKFVNNNKFG